VKSWKVLDELLKHPYLIVPEQLHHDIRNNVELEFINGCGSAQGLLSGITPSTIDGVSILAACIPHDAEYYYGQTLEDKVNADMNFLINILLIIKNAPDYSKISDTDRQHRVDCAVLFFTFVHEYGLKSFVEDKNIAIRNMTLSEQTKTNINIIRHAVMIPFSLMSNAMIKKFKMSSISESKSKIKEES